MEKELRDEMHRRRGVPVQKRVSDFIDSIARLYQAGEQRPGNSDPFRPDSEDEGYAPMSCDEIDKLCERLDIVLDSK